MRIKHALYGFALSAIVFGYQASGQSYAITNARIVTVSGPAIERGTVVVRNGLIDAVGANVTAPADAQVFDGTGLTVYPGFIDAFSDLGLPAPATPQQRGGAGGFAAGASAQQQADAASNSNYPAGLRPEEMAADAIRAGEDKFESARNAGFTTALSVGRSGIFNGQSVLIDLAGDSVSAMTLENPFAVHISFNTIRGEYPGSLLGTMSALRQMFDDAKRYDQLQKLYATDPKGMKRPGDDRSLEALVPVVRGEKWVVFNANRENDIVRALDLAKEYKLKAIIAGGQDAWKYADRLKEQNVPVLFSLDLPKRTASASPEADPESLQTLRFRADAPKGPGRLAAAGVKLAFETGDLRSLNDYFTNGGKVVEGGLSKDAAIRAMTLGAAEIFGVADRTGSVEVGKIANLTVVKGDVFAKDRVVTHVFVDGKLFEPKKPAADQRPGGQGGPGGRNRGGESAANLGGTYSITIEVPGQTLSGTLNLTQQGSELTGTMTTELGTVQISDGKAAGSKMTFSGTANVGGQDIPFTVSATVTDGKLSGTVDSSQGAIPISGTKNP